MEAEHLELSKVRKAKLFISTAMITQLITILSDKLKTRDVITQSAVESAAESMLAA